MTKLYVRYLVTSQAEVEVDIDGKFDLEEVKALAESEFDSFDFGCAENIEGEIVRIEDEHGKCVHEC